MFDKSGQRRRFPLHAAFRIITVLLLLVLPAYSIDHEQVLQKKNPKRVSQRALYEKQISQWIRSTQPKYTGLLTIPVVVHVLYSNDAENISEAQIRSQINAMNEDFQRNNADTINTPDEFKQHAASANIRFALAAVDPNGRLTNGIERKGTTVSEWKDNDAMKFEKSGGVNAWNTARYFNIWVCNLEKEMLGYGEYPSTVLSSTFGIVITPEAFGRTGSVKAPYDQGRTATHETGHCFDLYHLWGNDGKQSSNTDHVSDTPLQDGPTYGNPQLKSESHNEAPRMFMNYMDYSDDAVMNLFTAGQVERMRAVLSIAPYNRIGIRSLLVPVAAGESVAGR